MMCPVCKRDLAPTLSICLTCGAMINDSVREELETKISRNLEASGANSGRLVTKTPPPPVEQEVKPERPATQTAPPVQPEKKIEPPPVVKAPIAPPPPKPIAARHETSNLGVKKTSPTLVEFQTKKATVPEWRLQLQNSVRQKVGGTRRSDATPESKPSQPKSTSGANALKVEYVEADEPARHENPRVANALKRIEESRRTFSNQKVVEQPLNVTKTAAASRSYPFNVVAKSGEKPLKTPAQPPMVNASPKPMLVSPLKIEKKKYDTNKLPSLAQQHAGVTPAVESEPKSGNRQSDEARERWERLSVEETKAAEEIIDDVDFVDSDEIEDLAPLSMRFNAGIFDLIIGVFASLIILSPFIVSGGTWLSVSGFLAIGAVVAIVMFLYLTISIAFFGRTVGMRLFSLELVDVEENDYPTLHQAAVSSAVYLLSLAVAGLGFLPIFFNEERRAAHDILSGTILIREY